MNFTRDELVARLVKAGELEVMGGDQFETDSYFDTSRFLFHGSGGFETDYSGLTNYFKSVRAAFDDRSIRRGIIIVRVLPPYPLTSGRPYRDLVQILIACIGGLLTGAC